MNETSGGQAGSTLVKDLAVTLFETGNADCILVEFPDDSIGIIDFCSRARDLPQHPLVGSDRIPPVHFICLTHPHSDHLRDMAAIVPRGAQAGAHFWHSFGDFMPLARAYRELHLAPLRDRGLIAYLRQLVLLIRSIEGSLESKQVHSLVVGGGISCGQCQFPWRHCGVEIRLIGPRDKDVTTYSKMIADLSAGERQTLDPDILNGVSVLLQLECAGKRILFGADAMKANWRAITGRLADGGETPAPLGIDVLKVAHHGSERSFYPELLDDLFGEKPGDLLISADGVGRPQRGILEAVRDRRSRGLMDRLHCTGRLDVESRGEAFVGHAGQTLLEHYSQPAGGPNVIPWGDIRVVINAEGDLSVSQLYQARGYGYLSRQ